jgi:hypothetical protein
VPAQVSRRHVRPAGSVGALAAIYQLSLAYVLDHCILQENLSRDAIGDTCPECPADRS